MPTTQRRNRKDPFLSLPLLLTKQLIVRFCLQASEIFPGFDVNTIFLLRPSWHESYQFALHVEKCSLVRIRGSLDLGQLKVIGGL